MNPERSTHEQFVDKLANWFAFLDTYPGWLDWKRTKIGLVLSHDDLFDEDEYSNLSDFEFDATVEKQQFAITSYLDLATTYTAIHDCQYYFRRYPFASLHVSRDTHLRYMCEMYFNRVYEFQQRLKRCLNAINESIAPQKLEVGPIIKEFSRIFDKEIRLRNRVNHHERFEDIEIENLALSHLMTLGKQPGHHWEARHRAAYRKAALQWSKRVKQRAELASLFRDEVARAMLTHCSYLDAPASQQTGQKSSSSSRDRGGK